MKTFHVTINNSLTYTAIARSSFDVHDTAVDEFGVCKIVIVELVR